MVILVQKRRRTGVIHSGTSSPNAAVLVFSAWRSAWRRENVESERRDIPGRPEAYHALNRGFMRGISAASPLA